MLVYRAIRQGASEILRPSSSFVYVLRSHVPAVFVAPTPEAADAWAYKIRFTSQEDFSFLELDVDFVHAWHEDFDDWCEETNYRQMFSSPPNSSLCKPGCLDYSDPGTPLVQTITRIEDWPQHETPEGLVPVSAIRSARVLGPAVPSF